ncbi:type II toxin-antitoxin system HipA family toxin (plasmid) [Mesorhizobium loti]|uniref:Type II toxin-antitoxin system HipA family toxin n=1 Tax=Mesorhizobium jarvisii TaxID=1777867 RepID=A0A6M7TRH8_9HYPH|nr:MULTISPECIES: type II toxin-antitoxin system HipA family toxin [Mesorhizobium]OBQ69601.1 toxin HipA [Mesorhizobium loti]QKC67482.1 type II toxin-antitoxin system HipA family toxin [Mesorhizobium jarvisii]QKD13396.1 type II toxin-antitoxin system HipA family toxin [Mesorhizobium loti]RJT29506.1 type II toxin-antitoxin system HipA family toxin [Mesorhizobium jarvisii]
MARRRVHIPLNVFLNGRLVGILRRESTGAIDFQYAREWLDWRGTFPISLSLPLREDRYIGTPVTNVFDNLLPDNDAIRRRVAERVGADGTDPYSMLAALGHDCVGALQFLPDGMDPGPPGSVEGKPVSNEDVAGIIENLAAAPLGLGEDADFRISIAGAQEKTALLRKDGSWFKPIGTAATTHILKPQIGRLPNGIDLSNSVENEYLCLKLLQAFGVPAAQAQIADFGVRRTLIVERFDRLWARDGRLLRLPQEDICQALSVPPTRKYQSDGGPGMREIIELLKGSDTPDEDIATFLRTCILFWLIGATDGHAKNFSIFLSPGGRFRMTPLYDVLTAQPSLDTGQIPRKRFKLAMSVGRNRHYSVPDIMPRHFLQTADIAGVGTPVMRRIFDDIAENVEKQADEVIVSLPRGFPEQLVDAVKSAIGKRAALLADDKADAID